MRWLLDSYARKVRLSRWQYEALYRWFKFRRRLGIPKDDPTARYIEPELPFGESTWEQGKPRRRRGRPWGVVTDRKGKP
jgi:hypothetical protein